MKRVRDRRRERGTHQWRRNLTPEEGGEGQEEEEEEEQEEEINRVTSEDRITNDWRPVYGCLHKQHLR